jgi:hypothetical protein
MLANPLPAPCPPEPHFAKLIVEDVDSSELPLVAEDYPSSAIPRRNIFSYFFPTRGSFIKQRIF